MSNIMTKGDAIAFNDLRRAFFADRPKDVDGIANESAMYYRQYLLRKIFSIFEFTGIPDNWDMDYFLTHLFLDGFVCITDTEMGVIPLQCGIAGQNVYQHPVSCIIANPVLGSFERIIDDECVLLKLQYTYTGIWQMLNRYCYLLAACDSAISVSLMNSKVTFIGLCESDLQAKTMKRLYDLISMGQPAVFANENAVNPTKFFFNNAKQNFVADEVQLVKRSIINEFLTEIGIQNANTDKRERLVTDEVNANNQEIGANVQHWLDNIKEGLNKVRTLYGIDITVKRRTWRSDNESAESGGIS